MTKSSQPAANAPQPDDADPKSESMRKADTANGENPDADKSEPNKTHRTGAPQARENAVNESPA